MPAEEPTRRTQAKREAERGAPGNSEVPSAAEERIYRSLVRQKRIREAFSRDDLPVM